VHDWSFSTQRSLLQFPTMLDWIGPSVVTPFPGTVVVDVEVVLVDNWVLNVDVVFPEVDVVGVPDAEGWPSSARFSTSCPRQESRRSPGMDSTVEEFSVRRKQNAGLVRSLT
jgi:hypothetical protein